MPQEDLHFIPTKPFVIYGFRGAFLVLACPDGAVQFSSLIVSYPETIAVDGCKSRQLPDGLLSGRCLRTFPVDYLSALVITESVGVLGSRGAHVC